MSKHELVQDGSQLYAEILPPQTRQLKTGVVDLNKSDHIAANEIMKYCYLDYAQNVTEFRALPWALDGLKKVARRILYTVHLLPDNRFRKSAEIVGLTNAHYHPHGDSSVYGALVHLVQDFATSYPLFEGQGNFGSHDDPAAAFRYTEARLQPIAREMFDALIKNVTVPYMSNYNNSLVEPQYLPAKLPFLFLNGSHGIAVGVLTSIPPHNIVELCNATIAYIANPAISVDELMVYMPGPDFPGGEQISSRDKIKQIYETGVGKLILRANYHIEKDCIIFTTVPFQTSKLNIIQKIQALIESGKLNECVWVRDETNRQGIRIVIKLTRAEHADIMANMILSNTSLQTSYHAACYALDENNKVRLYNLKSYLETFVKFQHHILVNNAVHHAAEAKKKLHVLIGTLIALNNMEEVLSIIKGSQTKQAAKAELLARQWTITQPDIVQALKLKKNTIGFSEEQTKHVMEMRIEEFVRTSWEAVLASINNLLVKIKEYEKIASDADYRDQLVTADLKRSIRIYGRPRRSEISGTAINAFNIRDFIVSKLQLVVFTEQQYVKKVDLKEYTLQNRSGIGKTGNKETIVNALIANDRDALLLFTNHGYVYRIECYNLPSAQHNNKGRAIYQLLPQLAETKHEIISIQRITEAQKYTYILFIWANGYIRKNYAVDFMTLRSNGKIYSKIDQPIASIIFCNDDDYIMLATSKGKAIVMPVSNFRVVKQHTSHGVIGCKLNKGDTVIKAIAVQQNDMVLSILNTGFGKISPITQYRLYKNRGGKGIGNMSLKSRQMNETVSDISAINMSQVDENSTVLIITRLQQVIRIPLATIKESARNTRGTKLLNVKNEEELKNIICLAEIVPDSDTDE
jgi:DNA gyrase subunit A